LRFRDSELIAFPPGHPMAVRVRSELRPQRGMSVHLSFDVTRTHLFDAATGRRVPAASA